MEAQHTSAAERAGAARAWRMLCSSWAFQLFLCVLILSSWGLWQALKVKQGTTVPMWQAILIMLKYRAPQPSLFCTSHIRSATCDGNPLADGKVGGVTSMSFSCSLHASDPPAGPAAWVAGLAEPSGLQRCHLI